MTEQEAIKYIQEHNTISGNVKDMVIEALEKQIPKKVNKSYGTADLDDGKVLTFSCYPCPNCGCWLHDNPSEKYCRKCGQAFEDWSEN